MTNIHRGQAPASHMLSVSSLLLTGSHSCLSSEAATTTMSQDIFDKFRRNGAKVRADKPGSRPVAAICSALLPPNAPHTVSPTNLEYVSGGCWPETREAAALNTKNSSGVGRPRSSSWSRRGPDCLYSDKENSTGATGLTLSALNRNAGAPDQRCTDTSEPKTRSLSPPHPRSHTWLGQSSSTLSSNAASADSCVNCPENYNPTHRQELLGRGRGTLGRVSPIGDLDNQNVLQSMQTGGWEEKAYDSDARSDLDSHCDALRVAIAQVNISTDAISATASSAVLGPTLMPNIVCGGMVADKDFDCDSPETGSEYSVEADEMINVQPQVWKHVFRDAWQRARSKRGLKGQKADTPRCSFTV